MNRNKISYVHLIVLIAVALSFTACSNHSEKKSITDSAVNTKNEIKQPEESVVGTDKPDAADNTAQTPAPTLSPSPVPKPQEDKVSTPAVTAAPSSSTKPAPTATPKPTTQVSQPSQLKDRKQSQIQTDLFNYLSNTTNQESVKNRAMELNGGNQRNSCVYFASEALRRVGMDLALKVCNTGKLTNETLPDISLTYQLLKRGWKIERDLSLLLPGDLCFTTQYPDGVSTHVYTFMGWVKEGSTDYAYVTDNQSYDYGTTYHKRNVRIALPNKEATLYFMYKP